MDLKNENHGRRRVFWLAHNNTLLAKTEKSSWHVFPYFYEELG